MNVLSAVVSALKKHRLFYSAVLTGLVALVAGIALGVFLERNVGLSLSDRLERGIGTANAKIVSCTKTGSLLKLTVDFKNVSPGEEVPSMSSSDSMPQIWDIANYGIAVASVQEELTSNSLESDIDRVAIVCQHQGEALVTITGDRAPKSEAPFGNFEAHNSDGSTVTFFWQNDSSASSVP
ncbi:hypothetical protein [Caproicibacter sp.]|uniref:hypothetical protein n=1 Tax=Caproicibacter sp. TaxID=2814884 RepID=UPI00398A1C87